MSEIEGTMHEGHLRGEACEEIESAEADVRVQRNELVRAFEDLDRAKLHLKLLKLAHDHYTKEQA